MILEFKKFDGEGKEKESDGLQIGCKQACCLRIWSERKRLVERELLKILERRNNWWGRWR